MIPNPEKESGIDLFSIFAIWVFFQVEILSNTAQKISEQLVNRHK